MTLLSPGVKVTINDQSQYVPSAINSVPYILLATAANKPSGAGTGIAPGTLPVNANKTYLITSQRDLMSTYGTPTFYTDSAGNPLNGYELNEYGLLAAYSALGVTNRCYVQRADIDLAALTASLSRPLGSPPDGTYWLDTANTNWGIFEWNQVTGQFTNKTPTVFTDTTYLQGNAPSVSTGAIGDYGVVATTVFNALYYKRGGAYGTQTSSSYLNSLYNTWVLVGSPEWQSAWPLATATLSPTIINGSILINGHTVSVNGTVTDLSTAINNASIPGVYSAVLSSGFTSAGYLNIFGDEAASSGSSMGTVFLANDPSSPTDVLAALGISQQTYLTPTYLAAPSNQYPRWLATDTNPEPTGSVWQQTNSVNLGANLILKKYNATLGTWLQLSTPLYPDDQSANYAYDPTGGGQNIVAGATYGKYYAQNDDTAQIEIFEHAVTGQLVVAGSTVHPTFITGNSFIISASQPGSTALISATVILEPVIPGGTVTASDFCASISAANIPNVSTYLNTAGQIVLLNTAGGTINLVNVVGTPVTTAGFTDSVPAVKPLYEGGTEIGVTLSNWVGTPTFVYTALSIAPDQDPINGTYWYYSAVTNSADIMIQNEGQWVGYKTVTNDVRGYDLSNTDPAGPIYSTSAPVEQSTGLPLVLGDLWINTSDLENYPAISRWESVNGQVQWVTINNTDQVTQNGILFANARWAPNGYTNPITDPIPPITQLLLSSYVDVDAPAPALYPQGTLLFNLRRSGYNVKQFAVNYFNAQTFGFVTWVPNTSYLVNDIISYNNILYICIQNCFDESPANTAFWTEYQTNTWISASANNIDGSPTMGRKSQRSIIVAALKEGIDTSTTARDTTLGFNLLSCPQYPELGINLVALNDENNDTAFIITDTPLRLSPADIVDWASNSTTNPIDEPLNFASQYAGVWYPSCLTTDLGGNTVVQPPSHMMIRTLLRSDAVSYPWMAPAGTRRGVVDNAAQIGYIDSATTEFKIIGVGQSLRDLLYQNSVNPITFIQGVGITAYGQKTITSIASALDRINVARLVVFLRTRLATVGQQYLFEPNDQVTRTQFANAVDSLCQDLVAKRALYDYAIVCDLTNNTPTRIDNNELWLDLAIEPVMAVEFIYIPVRIMATGAIAAQSGGGATSTGTTVSA